MCLCVCVGMCVCVDECVALADIQKMPKTIIVTENAQHKNCEGHVLLTVLFLDPP